MSETFRNSRFEANDDRLYDLAQGDRRYYRLRIVRQDGSYFSVLQDDIHTLEGSADGTQLTLCIKGGLLVTLTGDRLDKLADLLEEYRVRKVAIYQPGAQTLKDPTGPVIRAIVEITPEMLRGK